jgi:hypothetical protein
MAWKSTPEQLRHSHDGATALESLAGAQSSMADLAGRASNARLDFHQPVSTKGLEGF